MEERPVICPRCGSTKLTEIDCGPDTWDDDITWTALKCEKCGLWYSGWTDKWLINVQTWQDEEDAEEYK